MAERSEAMIWFWSYHKYKRSQFKTKLELCAFALKGEHIVYSLVPNIPVCIYIDQKWIYIKFIRSAVGSNIVQITRSTFLGVFIMHLYINLNSVSCSLVCVVVLLITFASWIQFLFSYFFPYLTLPSCRMDVSSSIFLGFFFFFSRLFRSLLNRVKYLTFHKLT